MTPKQYDVKFIQSLFRLAGNRMTYLETQTKQLWAAMLFQGFINLGLAILIFYHY